MSLRFGFAIFDSWKKGEDAIFPCACLCSGGTVSLLAPCSHRSILACGR